MGFEQQAQALEGPSEEAMALRPGEPYHWRGFPDSQVKHHDEQHNGALPRAKTPQSSADIHAQAHLGLGQSWDPPPLTAGRK